MCGIVGLIAPELFEEELSPIISRMAEKISHRGPDGQGIWIDPNFGLALGHRRLSILDLSNAGSQPFFSLDRSKILLFNGEIYNFRLLAKQLAAVGHTFSGSSDTEVMLKAFTEWGCHEALSRMCGMFAFAYVDLEKQKLFLGRDRLGEKPLYYGWTDSAFLFSSELKAFSAYPGFRNQINSSVLPDYLSFGCIPGASTIFENVFKLLPGMILEKELSSPLAEFKISRYWDLASVVEKGASQRLEGWSEHEIVAELDGILNTVVAEHCSADVPVGAFLSGGIDSTLIAAISQKQCQKLGRANLQTFTVGFEEAKFDEAPYAKNIAKAIGSDHQEIYVGAADAQRVVELLPRMYDEPFGDSSQIPTFLVSELARKNVAVSLSGDGGDEVFAGYNRHFIGTTLWKKLEKIPTPLRRKLAKAWSSCPRTVREGVAVIVANAFRGRVGLPLLMEKVDKLITCLMAEDYQEMYFGLISIETEPHKYLTEKVSRSLAKKSIANNSFTNDSLSTMQFLDSLFYLPDDILVKVDRASMAASLEVRSPFLDHRVVNFGWSLPPSLKVRNGKGKWILRSLVAEYVNPELLDRPKSGFAIPISAWLLGPLRNWADDLLSASSLGSNDYLNANAILSLWSDFKLGKNRSQYLIWNLLMLQAWLREHQRNRIDQLSKEKPDNFIHANAIIS